jgi:arsenite-transporting ATPase
LEQPDQSKDISPSIVKSLKRINMITGKGGVGRSTLAAVLAKSSAESGKKTLLAELSDDHESDSALAGYFNLKNFRDESSIISKNLDAIRLSPSLGQSLFLTSFLKINALSQSILKNKGIQYFLEGAPAFREMGFFYHLLLQLRKSEYECIVLDLPATGHLIGLARLPRILLRLIPIGPIADRLKEGQSYFYDEKQTAAWVVTLPQTLPISEAIELNNAFIVETGPVGGFILNRAPINPFTLEETEELDAVLAQSEKDSSLTTPLERIRRFNEAKVRLCAEANATPSLAIFQAMDVFQPLVELTTTSPVRRITC